MTTAAAPRAWRVYLTLGRVSNLPTVWTNCAAGAALAGAVMDERIAWAALAISLFYTAGMYLNDAFDAEHDRAVRPERPIPRGLVPRRRVFVTGALLLGFGELMLVWPRDRDYERLPLLAAALGLALAACILYYSWRHKRDPFSPVVMALCRALVYVITAAWLVDRLPGQVLAGAAALASYVVALSQVAKYDVLPGRSIAMMIAGISILDAVMVLLSTGQWGLAGVTALGFPLTLALQRFTPGT